MQKLHLSIISLVVLLLFNLSVHAQTTTPASYYKGKWDILIKGTPNGDVHLIFNLQNVDETIKGSFVDPVSKADVDLTKTEYADGKPTLYFTVAGYDVNLVLEKKDEDHVSGSLMGMFEASGERVKDVTPASYYKGKWDMFIKGTPNGDVHLFFNLVDSAETVNGTFVDPDTNADVALTKTEFADGKPTLYFTVKGYDVSLSIEKKDDDHVAGSLMGMFEVTGERVKKQQ